MLFQVQTHGMESNNVPLIIKKLIIESVDVIMREVDLKHVRNALRSK